MREEIERLDILKLIAALAELFQIADLGRGIARNIDDAERAELDELLDELRRAALARRIDHHRGFPGWETDLVEDGLGGGG